MLSNARPTSGRTRHMDIMRGYGILCIVLGHVMREVSVPRTYVYSFHVAMFFFVSGYFFRDAELPLAKALAKWTKTLLIPYATFALLSVAIFSVFGKFAQVALNSDRGGLENSNYFFKYLRVTVKPTVRCGFCPACF